MEEYEGGADAHTVSAAASTVEACPGAAPGGRTPAAAAAGPPREPMAPVEPSVEPEAAKPARALLEEMLGKMGLDDVAIVYIARSEGEYFEVRGPRLANLIGRNGNTLEALNLIFNNILNAGVRNNRRYYTIDAEGYRARKADQLKTLALATLERVIREGKPIKLEPMLPSRTQDRASGAGRIVGRAHRIRGRRPGSPAGRLKEAQSRTGGTPPVETIAAIATPPGRGAIAIVRCSGPEARASRARLSQPAPRCADRVATYGEILDVDGARPRSRLGAGDGRAAHRHRRRRRRTARARQPGRRARNAARLLHAGARAAGPGEFTRRAFLNGKLDLSAAEAVADVIESESRAARAPRKPTSPAPCARRSRPSRAARNGDPRRTRRRDRLPRRGPRTPTRADLDARLAGCRSAQLAALIAIGNAAGWCAKASLAIVGPPNAGKSSLLNALLGEERAIVSPSPGTTRDVIEESSSSTASPVRVLDTAGLRASDDDRAHRHRTRARALAGGARSRWSSSTAHSRSTPMRGGAAHDARPAARRAVQQERPRPRRLRRARCTPNAMRCSAACSTRRRSTRARRVARSAGAEHASTSRARTSPRRAKPMRSRARAKR
jgi:hypothetical protein